MGVRLQRANFLVSDLDRALAFYRDVLGFEVAFITETQADSYAFEVFGIDRSAPTRWATLNAPGQERVMAVTEVPGLAPHAEPRRAAIVVEIADVDGVLQRAAQAGFHVFAEDELITHDGRVGREVGLLDGDGNLTLIYSINKA